jgi:cyclic beta-1,2-glucan synthetase
LREALEAHAWDGAWYLRGYYDNGEPLGSSRSEECRIDALAQAWSVLSGAAPEERARAAMDEVEARLISEPDRLIRLLAPPFDRTRQDPGYIKGYAPGVRENGGQYTHAALWVVQALVDLGRRDLGARLLHMLTPIAHSLTAEDVARYRVEPYVVAADVYGVPPHVGRGGWTWYTGSAGWMHRVALESLLGFKLQEGTHVRLRPGMPDAWPGFEISFTTPRNSVLRIAARRAGPGGSAVRAAWLDGAPLPVADGDVRIPFGDPGKTYEVEVVLG